LRNAGRVDEAETLLHEVLAVSPEFPDVYFQLGEISRKKGQYVLALERIRQAVTLGDDRPPVIARLAWLENENGNPNEARQLARTLVADQAQGKQVPAPALFEAQVAAGDFGAAFVTIRAALNRKEEWVTNVTTDPLFESLRRDGRWPELRKELITFARQLDLVPVVAPVPR
jgi:Flp pilus assembly protein TadD